tara:strand:+ start:2138 stop:2266 length:129 start_codon:yes stop_codon:yes gene_type:complete
VIDEEQIALYLDRHCIDGIDEKVVVIAHEQDLSMQEELMPRS